MCFHFSEDAGVLTFMDTERRVAKASVQAACHSKGKPRPQCERVAVSTPDPEAPLALPPESCQGGPTPQTPHHPGASLQLSEGCLLLSTGGWGQKPAGEGPASFLPPNGNRGPSGRQHPSAPTPWTNQIPIFLMRNMNGRNQHLGCAGPQG